MYENVIEWLDGDDEIAVTLHQKKFVNKILKLAKDSTNNVTILAQNSDGSIFAHLPISMLKLSPKMSKGWTDEEKSERIERVRKAQEAKMEKNNE